MATLVLSGGMLGDRVAMFAVDEGEGVRKTAADEDESFDDVDDRVGDSVTELGVRAVVVVVGALV